LPERHHPGQSSAQAKVRFLPSSRYTAVVMPGSSHTTATAERPDRADRDG
jgi:hypothetical protein